MSFVLALLSLFVVCFLLGSIPWGVIISRIFFHTDVREHGSGNIGTTNSFRTLGKLGGCAVFVLDFGKGFLAGFLVLFLCNFFSVQETYGYSTFQILLALAFLACIWGHIFSPWLGFKGGKGIAVAVGCLFAVYGVTFTLIELLFFVVLTVITRKVSVGSLGAAVLCPIIGLYVFWGNRLAWLIVLVAALTVIWAHRTNIARLRAGSESNFSFSKNKD